MSPYEHNARERKAQKIADHILGCYRSAGGDGSHTQLAALVIELAASSDAVRSAFARGAGTKKPSAATWLRALEVVARQGLLAAAEATRDPFAGLTEAEVA